MLTILSVLFAAKLAATSSIETTIRGTGEPLDIALLRRDPDDSWRQIANRRLPASQRRIDFDGLVSGVYQVRVRGSAAEEQAAAKVILGAGERRSAAIDIEPIELAGRVTLGDVPLGHAVIVLEHRDLRWRVAAATGDDGTFHTRLWQRGSFNVAVRSVALATPFADRVDVGGRSAQLDLRLPDRRIVGVVRDRVSGDAVAGATLHIESASGDAKHHLNSQAGGDGRFDLAAIRAGVVTIAASREGYLDGTSTPLTLNESDREREVAIALEPGAVVPMIVSDSAAQPLAGATLLTVVDAVVRARVTTGADGRARVTLPRDRAATLYAIPRDGSFAVVHVAKAAEAPRRITPPRALSSLRIVTRTTDGKPMPAVALLMRANGEIIPPAVAEELESLQDLTLRTDEHGEALLRKLPPGSYEFWPYANDNEAAAIVETAANLLAPIVVDVKTGENSVAVNFRAR